MQTQLSSTWNQSVNQLSTREIFSSLGALLFVACASAAAAQENHDELKQRIVTQAQAASPNDYAFTRIVRTQATTRGNTEKKVTVEKFDPAKPVGQQWSLVSVNGEKPSADALKEFREGLIKRRVPGYYRLAGYFGSPATVSTDSSDRTVFHFSKLPKDSIRVFDTDVSQNAAIDAAVNNKGEQPFVEEIRVTVRPMRIKIIAKLEQYESIARYHLGPEGRPLLVEQISDVVGSGLGQEGRVHSEITYREYQPVGARR